MKKQNLLACLRHCFPAMYRFLLVFILLFDNYHVFAQRPLKRQTRQSDRNNSIQVKAPTGDIYALVVGVSKYKSSMLDSLNYADADARNFYNFLQKGYLDNRYDKKHVKIFINDSASYPVITGAVTQWMENIKDTVKPGDAIFIYWSGHGMIGLDDQKLICNDSKIKDYNYGDLVWAMGMKTIKSQVAYFANKKDIKVYLIVDACRENMKDDGKFPIPREIDSLSGPGEVYLFACKGNERSFESDKLIPGSGIFTFFLLLGLEGGADTKPVDNRVTLNELVDFMSKTVAPYVAKHKGNGDGLLKQEPVFGRFPDSAHAQVYLTHLPKDVASRNREKAKAIISSLALKETVPVLPSTSIRGKGVGRKNFSYVSGPDDFSTYYQIKNNLQVNDTTPSILYDSIKSAIGRNELVGPDSNNAYNYYTKLSGLEPKGTNTIEAKSEMFVALITKVKALTDKYLEGKLTDARPEVFKLGYDELVKAMTLVPANSYFKEEMIPKLYFLKARQLAGSNNSGDWDEGLRIIESGLKASPHEAYLYLTKGILNSQKNRYFSAINCLDSALKYAPNWIYALYNLAVNNFQIQEYGASIKLCEKVIELEPGYSRAYSLYGLNLERTKDNLPSPNYNECFEWNFRAIIKDSANTTAYLNLGRLFAKTIRNKRPDLEHARYYLAKGGALNDPNCLDMLGKLYFTKGSGGYDSARYYYQKALAINPFHVNTLVDYYYLLMDTKRDSLFLNALRKSSFDYKIYAAYRKLLFSNNSPGEADEAYRKIIRINNEDPSVFIDHSAQFEQIDSIEKARAILWEGLFYIPKSPSLYYSISKLYFTHYDYPGFGNFGLDSAESYLKQLQKIRPDYSLTKYGLYQLYLLKGNTELAEALLRDAQQHNEFIMSTLNFNRNLKNFGDSAVKKLNYKGAISYYKLALQLNPKEWDLTLKIARSFYLQDKLDSATIYSTLYEKMINRDVSSEDSVRKFRIANLYRLQGLIDFEKNNKKDYSSAFEFFDKSSQELNEEPDHIEQVLTFYMLGNKKLAKTKVLDNRDKIVFDYKRILQLEGIGYSHFFVNKLKELVSYVGPGLFEPNIEVPQNQN
ncbi:MAG TPA: caspase family protein [Chitinophagaceae bacterium]|nr:caspase family protein [Chitinophagaceae bacterium]